MLRMARVLFTVRMVMCIWANFKTICSKVRGFISSIQVPFMKASSRITSNTGSGGIISLTATIMKVPSPTTWGKAQVPSSTLQPDRSTKAVGGRTTRKVMASSPTHMETNMKVRGLTTRKREEASFIWQTDLSTKGKCSTTISMDMDVWFTRTATSMKGSSSLESGKVEEQCTSIMVIVTVVNSRMTSCMELGSTASIKETNMKAISNRIIHMEWESTAMAQVGSMRASGCTAGRKDKDFCPSKDRPTAVSGPTTWKWD